ncbi:hypothetical protein ACFTAO_19900 [Paenibacillus rhizoplanae]
MIKLLGHLIGLCGQGAADTDFYGSGGTVADHIAEHSRQQNDNDRKCC